MQWEVEIGHTTTTDSNVGWSHLWAARLVLVLLVRRVNTNLHLSLAADGLFDFVKSNVARSVPPDSLHRRRCLERGVQRGGCFDMCVQHVDVF